jgi:ribokinase
LNRFIGRVDPDTVNASIVIVGSLNADLVVRVPRFPRPGETLTGDRFMRFPGGKGANQAYAAARLGGVVAMVGQVGADEHGTWLVAHLADAGVDTSQVLRDGAAPTGVALITIDTAGQNQIVLVPGANGTFTPDRFAGTSVAVGHSRVVLLQLEIPLATVVAGAHSARAAGAIVVLDPAPAQMLPDTLLPLADYLTPNETELATLTGGGEVRDVADLRERAAQLLARGAERVLVKWGARGAVLITQGSERWWPAHQVDVVDTTAAGDAFNGAFAVALAEGASSDAAGRFATAAAALAVTRAGAQPGMPDRVEVDALLTRARS